MSIYLLKTPSIFRKRPCLYSGQHCCVVPNVKHEIIDILVPVFVSGDRRRYSFVACIDTRCLDLFQKHNEHPLKTQTHTHNEKRFTCRGRSSTVPVTSQWVCFTSLFRETHVELNRKVTENATASFFLSLLPSSNSAFLSPSLPKESVCDLWPITEISGEPVFCQVGVWRLAAHWDFNVIIIYNVVVLQGRESTGCFHLHPFLLDF